MQSVIFFLAAACVHANQKFPINQENQDGPAHFGVTSQPQGPQGGEVNGKKQSNAFSAKTSIMSCVVAALFGLLFAVFTNSYMRGDVIDPSQNYYGERKPGFLTTIVSSSEGYWPRWGWYLAILFSAGMSSFFLWRSGIFEG
jgi:hypothetical protein